MPRNNQSRSSRAAASIATIVVACKAFREPAREQRQATASSGTRWSAWRIGLANHAHLQGRPEITHLAEQRQLRAGPTACLMISQ
jgi:hypothetical protein